MKTTQIKDQHRQKGYRYNLEMLHEYLSWCEGVWYVPNS